MSGAIDTFLSRIKGKEELFGLGQFYNADGDNSRLWQAFRETSLQYNDRGYQAFDTKLRALVNSVEELAYLYFAPKEIVQAGVLQGKLTLPAHGELKEYIHLLRMNQCRVEAAYFATQVGRVASVGFFEKIPKEKREETLPAVRKLLDGFEDSHFVGLHYVYGSLSSERAIPALVACQTLWNGIRSEHRPSVLYEIGEADEAEMEGLVRCVSGFTRSAHRVIEVLKGMPVGDRERFSTWLKEIDDIPMDDRIYRCDEAINSIVAPLFNLGLGTSTG